MRWFATLAGTALLVACGGGVSASRSGQPAPTSSGTARSQPSASPSPSAPPTPLPPPATAPGAGAPAADVRGQAWGRSTTSAFVGYDDHVTFTVENDGRALENLFVFLAVYDDWPAQHGMAMGTTPQCVPNQQLRGFDCGPLAAGASIGIILRSLPNADGSFHYGARFYERTGAGLTPLVDAAGQELLVTFAETVRPPPHS